MTDAERLAKAYTDDRGLWWPAPGIVEVFQRLIDSGVVTVNPPPDPAAQVRAEYVRRWGIDDRRGDSDVHARRRVDHPRPDVRTVTQLTFHTDAERRELVDLLAKAERLAAELSDAYREAQRILTTTAPIRPDGPSYHPERMGQIDELRVGDRALFAGGWREVADWYPFGDDVMVWFTDPDMDTLLDKGTHAIRIQKRVDEQEQDALHRRDTGGL